MNTSGQGGQAQVGGLLGFVDTAEAADGYQWVRVWVVTKTWVCGDDSRGESRAWPSKYSAAEENCWVWLVILPSCGKRAWIPESDRHEFKDLEEASPRHKSQRESRCSSAAWDQMLKFAMRCWRRGWHASPLYHGGHILSQVRWSEITMGHLYKKLKNKTDLYWEIYYKIVKSVTKCRVVML